MDQALHTVVAANFLHARADDTNDTSSNSTTADPEHKERPPALKAVGIALAIGSGLFIGTSFVVKKKGLLKSNEKYNEVAGEGYGYLRNWLWWTGMTLMIIGEICNFVAYGFVEAILVTPLGALSVVVATVLSAICLKERLSMVGKVGCFLCIVGSVVIVMNAPKEQSAATIQEMKKFVIAPGFLSYAGVIILAAAFTAIWVAPRYGKKSMFVYISICSWVGGLSVVATQGLGAAIVTQAGGIPQFNQWFLYVLLVFVMTTLVVEIVYLNKALNIFNAALVTPTYYVYFTSTTIITSAILFQGFKGTVTSIITVVLGFLTICAGVVLLQLSKSAKDVPDAAVFSGDLDQMRTIAEQEQPESEPKADAIRGAAAIVRRFSVARQRMEMEEARRFYEDKQRDLQPIGEGELIEWDGLRRRRTTIYSNPSLRSRPSSLPPQDGMNTSRAIPPRQNTPKAAHPPLGMSRFPEEEDVSSATDMESRPGTSNSFGASLLGTIRGARSKSMITPGKSSLGVGQTGPRSHLQPVPLTEMSLPAYHAAAPGLAEPARHTFGLPAGLRKVDSFQGQGNDRHITIADGADDVKVDRGALLLSPEGPTPPPHSAKRQFSFNFLRNSSTTSSDGEDTKGEKQSRSPMLRHHHRSFVNKTRGSDNATEEEVLGLVKGDSDNTRTHLDLDDDEPASGDDVSSEGYEDETLYREKGGFSPSSSKYGLQPQNPDEAGQRNLTALWKTGITPGVGTPQSGPNETDEGVRVESNSIPSPYENNRSNESHHHEEQSRSSASKQKDQIPPLDSDGSSARVAFI